MKKKITITVSEEMYNQLESIAGKMGITKNSLCTTYVAQALYNNSTVENMVRDTLIKVIEEQKN